tara:strand:- start:144 stop:587 length:444 start_codon:yes stop_codon:yes gene_type:complete
MVRKTKSGKDDKRSTSSATNAAKARAKLSNYVAKGKRMRDEASDEEDFDIRDSDFDSEPEPEPEPEPEKVPESTEEVPESTEKVPELPIEKNTFTSVRKPIAPIEPIQVKETKPVDIPVHEPQRLEGFQRQKYISISQMLRKSILRH